MEIKKDYGFYDLKEEVWSGAIDTIKTIAENDKEDELMQLLEEIFEEVPTITEVNDLLWFDSEWVFEQLGIEEEE